MSATVKREREPSPPVSDFSTTLTISPKIKSDGRDNGDVTAERERPKKKLRKTKATKKPAAQDETSNGTKGKRGSWTDEQDSALQAFITSNQGGNEVKAPWSEIFENFKDKFPDTDKTLNSLQMRWKTKLRGGDTDLSLAEKILFKQAVANIDGSERALAYAWRFKELSGKDLNKSAANKLLKMLKAGQLGADEWEVKAT
ncbi:hypothetical protein Dda_1071 [Drechslerella dactyloides]|uniref:Myb-like domain-containing protein n=1 Tax=Drechslerella dactyloides TaxID=74499 RepID=A0AAD6J5J2_DREDA|nr:hypothetical protein Dda_1071 [Drechslerella dactyloides]